MAVINIYIDENLFYDYYQNMTTYILITVDKYRIESPKKFDTAILHCTYKNGQIDEGKYLSPIYRTITNIHHITDFVILSIRA